MRFKLVKTGKCYAERQSESMLARASTPVKPHEDDLSASAQATVRDLPEGATTARVVWEGALQEYRSLLVLREAELLVAKAQLTGDNRMDWWLRNRIFDLEAKVADLKRWLTEAMETQDGS